jgi:hypothetical protein
VPKAEQLHTLGTEEGTFKSLANEAKLSCLQKLTLNNANLGEHWGEDQKNTGYLLEGRKGNKIEGRMGARPSTIPFSPQPV